MTWTQKAAQSSGRTVITGLVELASTLYGTVSGGGDSVLLQWDGVSAWSVAATTIGANLRSDNPIVYGGSIYALLKTAVGATTPGRMYLFSGGIWVTTNCPISLLLGQMAMNGSRAFVTFLSTGTFSMYEYVGTTTLTVRSNTSVTAVSQAMIGFGSNMWFCLSDSTVRYIGLNGGSGTAFTLAATLTGEYGTALGVHAGELYMGTSLGKLYKWNGASFDLQTTLASGKPITSIISYNSKVYCGISAT